MRKCLSSFCLTLTSSFADDLNTNYYYPFISVHLFLYFPFFPYLSLLIQLVSASWRDRKSNHMLVKTEIPTGRLSLGSANLVWNS